MKIFAFLALVGAASANKLDFPRDGSALVNNPDVISQVQADAAEHGWTAGKNAFFDGKTMNDARKLLGTILAGDSVEVDPPLRQKYYDQLADVPTDFDSREKWPGLILPIRNQEQCGSCWAFSAAETLGDRFSIASGKPGSPVLSSQDLVSCDDGDQGCSGGMLPNAWYYLKNEGIVTNTCLPYTSGTGNSGECKKSCVDNEDWHKVKHFAASSYSVNGVENMQKEIMNNGPIQVAFNVYSSFMHYQSGVYKKKWNEFVPEGGHAVKIIGWGEENNTPYWWVANSWGESWGINGFFKILRGKDECGIETRGPPYAGMPQNSTTF